MIVAGEVLPDEVAVNHDALGVTVNGTMLPDPTVLTCTVCEETLEVPELAPVKFSEVGETFSTGLLVTTSETGIAVTFPPATATDSVVL